MATEYKLSYTASEIDQKLATVDETKNNLESNYYTSADIDAKLEEVNTSVEEINTSIETSLASKADLVDGKVLLEQLPDDIGGGGEQVQADYEQNDSTQPDYINNRPFYATQRCVVIADNVSLVVADASNGEGLLWGGLIETTSNTLGDAVSVLYDGVSYELTKKYNEELGVDFFGNGSIANVMGLSLEDTGEPFMFAAMEDSNSLLFYTIDTQDATHTVTISQEQELIKTLDKKYLPEGMAYGYEEKTHDDIEWDENADGLPSVDFTLDMGEDGIVTYRWCKVNDAVLSKEEYVGATISISYPDSDESISIDSIDIIEDFGVNGAFAIAEIMIINIVQDGDSIDLSDMIGVEQTVTFPEAGIWFVSSLMGGEVMMKVTRLSFPSTLVQIDKKFLPDISDNYVTRSEIGVSIPTLENGKIPDSQLPSMLPNVSSSDSGKFLCVDDSGNWAVTAISEWSGGSY